MKIVLVPADANLAQWWFSDRQDPEAVRFNPLVPASVEALRERLCAASSDLADYEKKDAFFWAVKLEDQIVGHVTMQNINKMMKTAEIGYGVSSHMRGKGISTSAVSLLTKNIFSQTPIRKLIAFVHEGNLASRKVLEKIGFVQEGLLREHYLVNDKVANEIIYGLLRRDLL